MSPLEPKDIASKVYGCPSDIPMKSCLRWCPITQKPEVISRLFLKDQTENNFPFLKPINRG
jgi:hypothetical protein